MYGSVIKLKFLMYVFYLNFIEMDFIFKYLVFGFGEIKKFFGKLEKESIQKFLEFFFVVDIVKYSDDV